MIGLTLTVLLKGHCPKIERLKILIIIYIYFIIIIFLFYFFNFIIFFNFFDFFPINPNLQKQNLITRITRLGSIKFRGSLTFELIICLDSDLVILNQLDETNRMVY